MEVKGRRLTVTEPDGQQYSYDYATAVKTKLGETDHQNKNQIDQGGNSNIAAQNKSFDSSRDQDHRQDQNQSGRSPMNRIMQNDNYSEGNMNLQGSRRGYDERDENFGFGQGRYDSRRGNFRQYDRRRDNNEYDRRRGYHNEEMPHKRPYPFDQGRENYRYSERHSRDCSPYRRDPEYYNSGREQYNSDRGGRDRSMPPYDIDDYPYETEREGQRYGGYQGRRGNTYRGRPYRSNPHRGRRPYYRH